MSAVHDEALAPGEWTTAGPSETFELGRRVGARLRGGEVLLLSGPLGAGKTVFVKGLAEGRLLLYHLDLYRLDEGPSAAHAVDLDELLSDERAVIVIEWAERMGRYRLPADAWRVTIEGDGADPRRVRLAAADAV